MSWQDYIDDAIAYCGGKYDLAYVQTKVSMFQAQVWEGKGCAGVTWHEDYPTRRVLQLAFAGGDMDELRGLLPEIERFARDLGCQALEVHGRSGWERALKADGFKKISTTLSKEVAA